MQKPVNKMCDKPSFKNLIYIKDTEVEHNISASKC